MAERTFTLLEHTKQEAKTNLDEYTRMITATPPPWNDMQKIEVESQIDLLKENLASWMQFVEKIDEQIKRMKNENETKQTLLELIDAWKIDTENSTLLKNVKQAIFKGTKYASLKVGNTNPNVGHVPPPPLAPIKVQAKNIQKFHGDYLNWKPFWQRFELNIHSQAYSNVEKLDALFGLLEGKALKEVQGFSIIDENYDTVINTLKTRFGNEERILFELQNQLSSIPPAKPYAKSICDTVQSIHNLCRQLQNHGVDIDNSTLKLDIIRKMPAKEQAELIMLTQTNPNTTTETILTKMKEYEMKAEITDQLHKQSSYYSKTNEVSKGNTPPRSPSKMFRCSFCNGLHFSSDCQKFPTAEDKIKELKNTNRCTKCTRSNHTAEKCFANIVCKNCNGKHYTFLCNPKGNTKPSNTKQSNVFITVEKRQGCLLAKEITVMNRETNETAKAVVFFDSGSQRTFVSNKLINQLKLQTLSKEHLNIRGIGGKTLYYESNLVELRIETIEGHQDIFANSIKSIAKSIPVIEINGAESYTIKNKTPDILIGMDYFFKFITSVKENNGTFFVDSLVGPMVAGNVPVTKDPTVSKSATENDTKYHSEQKESQKHDKINVTSYQAISNPQQNAFQKTYASGEGSARRKIYSMNEWFKIHDRQYGSYEDQQNTLTISYEETPD